MWHRIAAFIIKFRILLLILLLGATAVMGYFASKVELSYEFTNAVPTDNQKYIDYQAFRKQFGEDGNLMVLGVQTDKFFTNPFFNDYTVLVKRIEYIKSVENVLSVPTAITLTKNEVEKKFIPVRIAGNPPITDVDNIRRTFLSLLFYRGSLYNPKTNAYLMAISINKQVLNSKNRSVVIGNILQVADSFGKHKRQDEEHAHFRLHLVSHLCADKRQA